MKVMKTSPGIEELHRPVHLVFEYNVPVEVPDDIGQALVKKQDYVLVESKKPNITDNYLKEKQERKRRK